MKRVKAACICQTLHFLLKEDVSHDYALELVEKEYEQYKANLTKNNTQFKIIEETREADGSIVVKIIKQYNECPVGSYLD